MALLLQFSEHSLDAIAILVASIVGMDWHLPVRPGRDNGQNSAHEQVFAEPIAVIALVGKQRLGLGQWQGHQFIDRPIIRSLTSGQDEPDRQSLIVTAGVDLARKAAA